MESRPTRSSQVTVSGLACRAYETFATHPALVASDGTATTFRELGELASRVALRLPATRSLGTSRS